MPDLHERVGNLEERIYDLSDAIGDIAANLGTPSAEAIPEEPPSDLQQLIDRIGKLEGLIRHREHETFEWFSCIAKHLGIGNISQPVESDVEQMEVSQPVESGIEQTEIARVEDAVYSNKLMLQKIEVLLNLLDNKAQVFVSRVCENKLLLESIKAELGLVLGHVNVDDNMKRDMKSNMKKPSAIKNSDLV